MFFEINKNKAKNFFAICNTLAEVSPSSRKIITERTSLSYPTVSHAVEDLLDLGILKEKHDGKSFSYSLSNKYYFTVIDIRGIFKTVFTGLSAKELSSFEFKESDAFFFDEKLSLFLRNTASIEAKHYSKLKAAGLALILPSVSEPYRDTRGLLSSRERLERLTKSYFPKQNIILTTAADSITELCTQKKSIILTNEGSSVLLKTTGYGIDGITPLRSLRSTSFTIFKSTAELASEIAYSIGNLCSMLSPDEIVIDGTGLLGVSSFPRYFRRALALYNCTSEDGLPTIRHFKGDAVLLGTVRLLRNSFINALIDQHHGDN